MTSLTLTVPSLSQTFFRGSSIVRRDGDNRGATLVARGRKESQATGRGLELGQKVVARCALKKDLKPVAQCVLVERLRVTY